MIILLGDPPPLLMGRDIKRYDFIYQTQTVFKSNTNLFFFVPDSLDKFPRYQLAHICSQRILNVR